MRAILLLLCLVFVATVCHVQADGLRSQITHKLMTRSQLYDQQLSSANVDPLDVFTSNQTNITNPQDLWQGLPSWLQYTFGTIIALVGIVITFYGVRLLPLSVFLLGGFIAAIIMYAILAASVPNDNTEKTAIVYGTSAAVWIVVGGVLACCIPIAVFVLGAGIGVVIALVLNPIALKYVWPAEPLANMIIWVVVFGLIGGAIACCLKKPLLIVATSGGGAFAVVASIMAMCGTLNIAKVTEDGLAETTWQDWAGFGGFLGLTLFGSLIQLCITARDTNLDGYSKLD